MEENNDTNLEGFSWEVPEFEKHERSKEWYMGAIFISIFLLVFAVFSSNFLFAIIIIVTALIYTIHDGKDPEMVKVSLSEEGVTIGKNLYEYDILKNFAVLYKPREGVSNLYFDYKNPAKMRISVSLQDENPLQIRDFLLKYLEEDLERVNLPLSENLSKLLKV